MFAFLIFIFLLLSAFFSASEMMLLTLSKFQIRKLVRGEKYKKLLRWIHNPSWFITGILIGNTASNIGFSTIYSYHVFSYAEKLHVNGKLAALFSFFTATFLLIIFGEILPKNLGKFYPRRLLVIIYKPLLFFIYLFSPIIWIVSTLERKLVGKKHRASSRFTRDDFHKFIIMCRKEGYIQSDMERMIHSFLDLKKTKVSQIMTPRNRIEAIDKNAKYDDILYKIYTCGRSRIPVYRGTLDEIEGVLNVRDLLSLVDSKKKINLSRFVRNPIFIDSNEKVENLLKHFKSSRKHMAIVIKQNKIVGLVTMEDILEEITGEILDEYDVKRGE